MECTAGVSLIETEGSPELQKALLEGLRDYAVDTVGDDGGFSPIAIEALEGDELVGGLLGRTFYGCAYISNLWVAPSHRHQGLGTSLVNQAIETAKERGCRICTVNTMSFFAPDFYLRLGFEIEHIREGYDGGHRYYTMSKRI